MYEDEDGFMFFIPFPKVHEGIHYDVLTGIIDHNEIFVFPDYIFIYNLN
jgi:hypothetical protein